ncbi:hypothetical protein YDYSY3_39090 [Paenibacillus chitinolyticus]|uniref:PD-(D/E)XK nuclease family protein n=1 Tax=Paenibacillus chitinolyticus TaxID=79263 RepID=UPI0026E4AD0C|nr:PD-(D/E)XK nuclease family protein [Paenibacillus chitinolyticus]GKS12909.1 hypothetical protein YDYSY3_39090 [Paenibacillus chitinolyticus]
MSKPDEDNMQDIISLIQSVSKAIIRYEHENPIDYNKMGQLLLKNVDRRLRTEHEMLRFNRQLDNISHDQVKDYVASKSLQLFNLVLEKKEATLIKSRIDILTRDKNDNYVGIEIKKIARFNEAEQFVRYKNELVDRYGPESRLIVLGSRFTPDLLEQPLEGIELWRYEVWRKTRKHRNQNLIDILRVCMLTGSLDNIYCSLFEDKIRNKKLKR